ncbi:hypothetical protein, partial [Pseudomonas sp.]|uniref:hypothetical protein n=1 Tax=Pseudomonas sp. TaxID=306 RepID=UPI0025F1B850
VGLRSSPKPFTAFLQTRRGVFIGAAAQPNAGQARSPQRMLHGGAFFVSFTPGSKRKLRC